MNEVINAERRDALIESFTNIAKMDLLTNMDALMVIEILRRVCKMASVELEEGILKAMIDGPESEDDPRGTDDSENSEKM